jgi:general stress protein 26
MGNSARRDEGVAKIRELIEGIRFAMLTTVCPDGSLHSRPMAAMNAGFDGTLWFFTKASSHKVDEVRGDHHVNVAYAAPDDSTWVTLSGVASLSRDKAKMEELWTPELKAYFPEGLDDPDIALIKVDVRNGEYWEGPGAVAYAIELVASVVTGERASPGEHEKVRVE